MPTKWGTISNVADHQHSSGFYCSFRDTCSPEYPQGLIRGRPMTTRFVQTSSRPYTYLSQSTLESRPHFTDLPSALVYPIDIPNIGCSGFHSQVCLSSDKQCVQTALSLPLYSTWLYGIHYITVERMSMVGRPIKVRYQKEILHKPNKNLNLKKN